MSAHIVMLCKSDRVTASFEMEACAGFFCAEEEIGGYMMSAAGPITHQFVCKHQIYVQ